MATKSEWIDGSFVYRSIDGQILVRHKEGTSWSAAGAGPVVRRLDTLAERVRELEGRSLKSFNELGADRLADEVAALVTRGFLDSRSAAADALIDYREPPRTPRSDRIAALEAEVEAALRGQVEISGSNARMFDKLQERERKLREALAETTAALENFRFAPAFAHEPVILRSRDLLKEE